jgi:hypothetical protein
MPMHTRHDIDDEEEERQRRYVRVPMTMMDGLDDTQRAIAASTAPAGSYERYVADHAAEMQRHAEAGAKLFTGRTGYVALTDEQRQQRNAAYLEHCRQLSERWRKPAPQPKAADSTRAPQRTNDAENAREEYVRHTSNAWRRP